MPTSNEMRNRARRLRATPSEAQRQLWTRLQPLRLSHDLAFRRQHPIGPFLVDFACLKAAVVVTLDADPPADAARDRRRDAFLAGLGFQVLRFGSQEAARAPDAVAESIVAAAQARRALSLPKRSPSRPGARRYRPPPRRAGRGGGWGFPAPSRKTREDPP